MHKIGIISDIHGNIEALQRALILLENDLVVDEIVCTGDLVDRGVDASGVIALIQQKTIPTVAGNHDRSAPQVERDLRNRPEMREFYAATPLSDEDMAFLDALPQTLSFEREGVSITMAHGSPWNVGTYILPNALRKMILRVVEENGSEITLLGHTHEPMLTTLGDYTILNAGSVAGAKGRLRDKQTCAVLELPSKQFTVYDINTTETLRPARIKYPAP